MEDCIFCKIISSNSIYKIYKDNWTVAFLDIAKDVDAVKRISNHLIDCCDYEGVNLLNASGESAGQSVPHLHIHLIPRKKKDGIDAWPTFAGAKYELETMLERIKM